MSLWRHRYGLRFAVLVLMVSVGTSWFALPMLDGVFKRHVLETESLGLVRSLLLTLGGALFGASAIVSSLVLFAMQVNIERMPHGLFRRFGADPFLLAAFAATFVLSLCVLALPLLQVPDFGGLVIFGGVWSTALILLLFLATYRRALSLVNPTVQLKAVVDRSKKDIRRWARRAERARPLIENPPPNEYPAIPYDGKEPDLQKTTYLKLNSHWTREAKRGVEYAVSYAHRFAEQGDYEVSRTALNAVGNIVAEYVEAKDGTFFSQSFLIDNPFSTDGFINETLEQLRQMQGSAVARGDEQHTEQVISLLSAMVRILSAIDYGRATDPKTHAHLAAAYLAGAVEKVVPLQQTDVLMHGLREMGRSGLVLIAKEGPNAGTTLAGKIGIISAVGLAKKDLQPVTSTGVEQLAQISFSLLMNQSRQVGYAAKQIRSTLKLLVEFVLGAPEAGFFGTHSTLLGPYYSATSTEALSSKLLSLVQGLRDLPENNENAQLILRNLVEWSDQMYTDDRSIFKLAIDRRSKFISDHFHWIINVTKALLAAASAPACSDVVRRKLQRNAIWLVSTISWIPEEEEAVAFVEHYQITEDIFDLARVAKQFECFDVADVLDDLLLSWGLKAGAYVTGWQTLEDALCGLAVSKLIADGDGPEFDYLRELQQRIDEGALENAEIRANAAQEIRERVRRLGTRQRPTRIFAAMERVDAARLATLLEATAAVLAGERGA